jgi:glucokinase
MTPASLGVDIGGTTTKAAMITGDGAVLHLDSIPTASRTADEFVRRLCLLLESVWRRGTGSGLEAAALGVAVAGFLNPERDRLAYNPNLAWLEQFPLREALAARFPFPVILEVDSNASALAEWRFGSGSGSARFLCLTAGTGLGGGMIVDGKILRFAYECLGDVGHVIVEPGGTVCSCGGVGCAEALIGANAVTERFRRAGGEANELRDVIAQARSGNAAAIRAIGETGRLLGLTLATLAIIFFPDRIAIAGGLSEAGALLLDPAEEAFRTNASPFASERATVVKASLGWQATLRGAGLAARQASAI